MKCIIFGIADSISHYNASFRIAKKLKEKGHRIVFLSDNDNHVKEVNAQGFECEIIYNDFYKKTKDLGDEKEEKKSFIGYFHRKLNRFRLLKKYKKEAIRGKQMESVVEKYKPALFILDIFHVFHFATIYKFGIKVVILQTYVNTSKGKNTPPLNSSHIPQSNWQSIWYTEMLWTKLFAYRFFLNLWAKFRYLGMDKVSVFKTIAKRSYFPEEKIDFKRSFHWGIHGIPELILSAEEFDFHPNKNVDQHYVGPAIELERREVLYDTNYLEVTLQREIAEISEQPIKPIIYCSLGTLNTDWYSNCYDFFKKVIQAFGALSDYELYLSVGPDMKLDLFVDIPENVHIFNLVPQLDVLQKASLMITHGGINSINECIFSGVPMITYPLSSNIDQNGNSARVVYHKLGMRGNIRKESVKGIKEKIEHILCTPVYKQNIDKMKAVYEKYHRESTFMNVIESQLSKSA